MSSIRLLIQAVEVLLPIDCRTVAFIAELLHFREHLLKTIQIFL